MCLEISSKAATDQHITFLCGQYCGAGRAGPSLSKWSEACEAVSDVASEGSGARLTFQGASPFYAPFKKRERHTSHPRHVTPWLFLYEAVAPPAVCFETAAESYKNKPSQGKLISQQSGQQAMCTDEPDFGVSGSLTFVKGKLPFFLGGGEGQTKLVF